MPCSVMHSTASFTHSRSTPLLRPRIAHCPTTRHIASRQVKPCRALEIDWTAPDTLIGLAGAVLGIGLGIGVPVFYISRDTKDKESLEYVREMNRKRFAETGEYMTKEEIAQIRQPRWTDNREFQDDD